MATVTSLDPFSREGAAQQRQPRRTKSEDSLRRALPPGAAYGHHEPDRIMYTTTNTIDRNLPPSSSTSAAPLSSTLSVVPERSNSASTSTSPQLQTAKPLHEDSTSLDNVPDPVSTKAPAHSPVGSPTEAVALVVSQQQMPPLQMEGPYPALSSPTSKGKLRETIDFMPVDDPVPKTSPVIPLDMAGVGRNSIVKAAPSPTSLMGPPPFSTTATQGNAIASSSALPPPSAQAPVIAAAVQPPAVQSPAAIAAGVAAPSSPLPPHLVPQPEICIECMMRDRDMADVDVTGDGVWDRDSDQDFYEALRFEMEDGAASASEESASVGLGARTKRRSSRDAGSRESSSYCVSRTSLLSPSNRKRIGRGQPLTESSLKLWTSMNPPASSHRWRTLKTFLATQAHLIELEKQAREQALIEKSNREVLQAADKSLHAYAKGRSGYTLPNGLVVEKINVNNDEREGKVRARSRSSRASMEPPPSILPPVAANFKEQLPPTQPWLTSQTRRFSNPIPSKATTATSPIKGGASSVRSLGAGKFARSSVDLRSIASPKSISPSRHSLTVDDKRTSMWSRFRQSSHSVLSFAPSGGSMLDMHLGLSMDKHNHVSPYDMYAAGYSDPSMVRPTETSDRVGKAEAKKKGIKAFFGKLKLRDNGGKKKHSNKKAGGMSASAPATPHLALEFDDADLRPPPPLSALANEPRYSARNGSSSSVDSYQPFTPPALHPRALSTPLVQTASQQGMAGPDYFRGDRGSIMTMGSLNSTRSKLQPAAYGSGNSSGSSPMPPARATFQRAQQEQGGSSGEPSPPNHKSYIRPSSPSHSNAVEEIDPYQGQHSSLFAKPIRKEKSLPSLPSELLAQYESDDQLERERAWASIQARGIVMPTNGSNGNLYYYPSPNASYASQTGYHQPYYGRYENGNRSTTSFRTPSLSPAASRDFGVDEAGGDGQFGGGKRSKARSKLFSIDFLGLVNSARGRHVAGAKGNNLNKSRSSSDSNDAQKRSSTAMAIPRGDQNHDFYEHYGPHQQQQLYNTNSYDDSLPRDRQPPRTNDLHHVTTRQFDTDDTAVNPAAIEGIHRENGLVSIRF